METLSINGVAVVSRDQNNRVSFVSFLPDDELAQVIERGSLTNGQLQLMRNAAFDYVPNKPRVRANSTLLRKAAHGRISATRDGAFQLTLKIFKREGLDVKETMLREAMDLINNVKL